jgi:transcriptional regulator with XRE-family HTH domain
MKNDDFLKDCHIGKIIKEIALQRGVSSKKLAEKICRYQQNADKIFKLDDMDIEDVIRISYLLEYNILDVLAQKYLSHLPCSNKNIGAETCLLKIDVENRRVTTYETINNYDFLKKIYIGQYIRDVAKKNDWSGQYLTKRLNCAHSAVSALYKRKSIRVKSLIRISYLLQYHFIGEVYLSQMIIVSSINKFDNYILTMNSQQICILDSNDETILMIFQRNDDKK